MSAGCIKVKLRSGVHVGARMHVCLLVGRVDRKEGSSERACRIGLHPSLLVHVGWLVHFLPFFLLGFGDTGGWARKPFPPPLWEAGSMGGEGNQPEGRG